MEATMRMYEPSQEIILSSGSASSFPNNLSVFHHEAKHTTFACIAHKNQVNTVNWDPKMEGFTSDTIPIKNGDCDKPLIVLQAKYCMPLLRSFPLLVIASPEGAMIFDPRNSKMLAWSPIDSLSRSSENDDESSRFTRGISCVENTIVVGTFTGDILVFSCSGENSVQAKKPLQEHKSAIADIATCNFDELTCSCDVSGVIAVWSKSLKSVQKTISTEHEINCMNVLRKQAIVGTFLGQLLFYSTLTGQLMAEVNAHVRQINAIAVAPESAYVMSAGDDTVIRIWKLHTRKPESYKVEWRHNEIVENMPLMGAQFTNGRGSAFVVAAYDYAKLFFYKIAKKTTPTGNN
ncbi:WD repeat-containing protein 54 [Toxocara canis]|uniref:WD repeat-containing protein 54 n=1 Tax=Toxocara canis TaxID=6265 RepID=A0A0B2VUI3_TOXCA|nr:WD repeat-containing protein 54 [Toxocara canis]